jgi:16S rRNA (guanine527-N7)-methyltransferase
MSKRTSQDANDTTLGSVDPAVNPPVAFSDADWEWFAHSAAFLGIEGAPQRRTALEALFGHLLGVNRWLNLTKLISPREYLKYHVLDSLVAERDTRLRHLSQGSPCVDLGSGGGYPGLPLALWHADVPWVLVDARMKKVEFLAAACPLTGNPRARAAHLRGNEVHLKAGELHRSCQLVTCRAMGRAAEVLGEARDLLHKTGHLLLFKGPTFAGEERNEALKACDQHGYRFVNEQRITLEPGDPQRVLVVFQRLS